MENYYVMSRGFGDNSYAVKEFANYKESAEDYARELKESYMREYEDNTYAQNCFFCKVVREI